MDEKEAEARPLMGTIFLVLILTLSSKKCSADNLDQYVGIMC